MSHRLDWNNVMAWRLARHGLVERVPSGRSLDVISRICGLHAQLLGSAGLSLWARAEGVASTSVGQALWQDRSLVKTWAMRGTLHLLPASEYWLWQAGLSTYDHHLRPSWLKYFGVTRQELESLIAAVEGALDGRMLTREELAGAVAKETGSPDLGNKMRESWGALLKPASFQGKLCFAPNWGQNVRFTNPCWWLGRQEEVDDRRALTEITRRFLGSHGPATRDDYARWWGVSPAKALARIRELGDEATEIELDGARCWMLSETLAEAAGASVSGRVNLVPAFDPYVIAATRHAGKLLPGSFSKRIYRPQGWISPVLLVDGRMEGTWSHEKKGNRLLVTIEPFGGLPRWARDASQAEAASLSEFFGCGKLELSFRRDDPL